MIAKFHYDGKNYDISHDSIIKIINNKIVKALNHFYKIQASVKKDKNIVGCLIQCGFFSVLNELDEVDSNATIVINIHLQEDRYSVHPSSTETLENELLKQLVGLINNYFGLNPEYLKS